MVGVDWDYIMYLAKRAIIDEIRYQMANDKADPHGEFVISYCAGDIKFRLKDLQNDLMDAWCK